MAVSPGTTNLAVDLQTARHVRGIAKELGLTTIVVTNFLLDYALRQENLTIEPRVVKFSPRKIQPIVSSTEPRKRGRPKK